MSEFSTSSSVVVEFDDVSSANSSIIVVDYNSLSKDDSDSVLVVNFDEDEDSPTTVSNNNSCNNASGSKHTTPASLIDSELCSLPLCHSTPIKESRESRSNSQLQGSWCCPHQLQVTIQVSSGTDSVLNVHEVALSFRHGKGH